MFYIVIPSRSRAGNVVALRYLPHAHREHAIIVVPIAQMQDYSSAHPGIHVYGCPADGIAPTRQWILENFCDKYLFFLDDDARFFVRKDMNDAKLTPILDDIPEQKRMWDAVGDAFHRGFAWVGISYRSGNNFVTTEYRDNTKSFSVWGINADVVRSEEIRFDVTPVMEDFQVILSLLTRGYENRVYYRWCWDQASSQAPGGCSDWRTPEIQAKTAHKLARLFPSFVKVKEKETKGGWWVNEEGKRVRVDVTIQWKKAAKSATFLR